MQTIENLQGAAEENSADKGTAIALPRTVSALMEQKKTSNQRTLNDHVESIHLSLYEDAEYQQLIDAVYPEQAVEGSLIADDLEAARMIREKARAIGDLTVANQKLATLVKSLGVVLRRFGIGRKERRES